MLLQTLAVKTYSLGMCLSSYRRLLTQSSAISAPGTAGRPLRGTGYVWANLHDERSGLYLYADFRIVTGGAPHRSASSPA